MTNSFWDLPIEENEYSHPLPVQVPVRKQRLPRFAAPGASTGEQLPAEEQSEEERRVMKRRLPRYAMPFEPQVDLDAPVSLPVTGKQRMTSSFVENSALVSSRPNGLPVLAIILSTAITAFVAAMICWIAKIHV